MSYSQAASESLLNPISLLVLLFFFFLLGWCSSNKALCSIVSNWIRMKLGQIVLQVNTHQLMESDCWCDGCHNVHPVLAVACGAVSAGCLLAHQAHVTSLARCVWYSSWSIVHSYLVKAAVPYLPLPPRAVWYRYWGIIIVCCYFLYLWIFSALHNYITKLWCTVWKMLKIIC